MVLVNGQEIPLNHFNDKTFYLLASPPPTREVTITWLYEDEAETIALMYLTRHLQDSGRTVSLNMPFCPNARQDRVAAPCDILTLKYFAEFINSLNFSKVYIFDPHSDVTPAVIDRCVITTPEPLVQKIVAQHPNVIIVYPDSGSAKKYGPMLKLPYLRGIKVRNFETQKIESFQLVGTGNTMIGNDILIVDDICGTGHTLYKAARELKSLGAHRIYIYVSHCEPSVLRPYIAGQSLLDIPDLITKVYTTNSIFNVKHPKVEIIYDFLKGE